MCYRCLMPSGWPILCPSPCSPMVPPRKQRQSCSTLSTRTLICGQASLSGKRCRLWGFLLFFFVIPASSKSVSRQTFLFLENVDNLCESCRSCCFLLPLCVLLDFTTRGRQSWTFSICAHSGFNAGMCADGKPITKNDNRNYIIYRI